VELAATNTNLASHLTYGAGSAVESGTFTDAASKATRSYAYAGINKANFSLLAVYYDIGPDYHPLDAYVAESDIRGPNLSGSLFTTVNPSAAVRQLQLTLNEDRYLDQSGEVRQSDSDITASVTFKDLVNVGLGQYLGSLRQYQIAFPQYTDGITYPYNSALVFATYRAGTPNSLSVSYSWGPFSTYFLQQLNFSVTHQFSKRYSAEVDFSQVGEHYLSGLIDSQVLRRLSLFGTLSRDETLSIAFRQIEGTGGFSAPGTNLAIGYYRRFGKGSTLNIEVGSPASSQTLNRYIIKWVQLIGSGAGE
jgi:hypothetical protein